MTLPRRKPSVRSADLSLTIPGGAHHDRPDIPPFEGFDPGGIAKRVIRGLNARKWAVVFIRQSTKRQMVENLGSGEEQGDQARHLRKLGIADPAPYARYLDARGESGRHGANRRIFEELEAMVRSGTVACVLVTREDRLGRNNEDSTRLLTAMAERGAILFVNGIPYDPADVRQQFQLLMALGVAALDGGMRVESSMVAKRRRAEHFAFRLPLPAGLVWADPADRRFLAAAGPAGIGDRLSADALAAHRAKSPRDGRTLYVLPYPDREVRVSCELRVKWLFQFRSVGQVLAHIRRGAEGWPHAGKVPITGGWSWGAKSKVTWVRATRGGLRDWFRSPPIYGIYWYRSPWIGKRAEGGEGGGLSAEKREDGAFPGFATSDAYEEALAILHNPSARLRMGKKLYHGARNHAIPVMRCAHPVDADGTRCGTRVSAFPKNGREPHTYGSLHCREAEVPHTCEASSAIDKVVLDILLETFHADALREAVDAIRADAHAVLGRRDTLAADVRRLEGMSAEALIVQVEEGREYRERRANGELPDVDGRPPVNPADAVKALRADYERQLAELRPRLVIAERDGEALRAMTDRDLDQMYAIGSDLGTLLARAAEVDGAVRDAVAGALADGDTSRAEAIRAHEGRVRAAVEALVQTVWLRQVGAGLYEVEVEFPTGARVRRTLYTEHPRATDGERLYAYGRHVVAGESAEAVSVSLVALRHLCPGRPEWTPARVRGAALSVEFCGLATGATPDHRDVAEVAASVGEAVEDVMAAVLVGTLDGVAVGPDGALRLAPSDAALHRAFPEYARRAVATEEGWPVSETVTVPELRKLRGVSWGVVENLSRRMRVVPDAARRRYVRRDRAALTDPERIEVALRTAPESVRQLDRQHWVALRAVPALLGNVAHETIRERCPVIRYGTGPLGYVFVHVPPAVRAELRHESLDDAVRRYREETGRRDVDATEFVPRQAAVAHFSAQHGLPTLSHWIKRCVRGGLPAVRASSQNGVGAPVWYVHVPRGIWRTTSAAKARAWWDGLSTNDPEDSSAISTLSADAALPEE